MILSHPRVNDRLVYFNFLLGFLSQSQAQNGARILLFGMDSAGPGQPDSTRSTANYRLSSPNYIEICPWWLPWQDSKLPKKDMICPWESSLKAKATEYLCWVDPYLIR